MMIEEKCFEAEDEGLPAIDTSGINVVEHAVLPACQAQLLSLVCDELPGDMYVGEFRRLVPAFQKAYEAGFNAGKCA